MSDERQQPEPPKLRADTIDNGGFIEECNKALDKCLQHVMRNPLVEKPCIVKAEIKLVPCFNRDTGATDVIVKHCAIPSLSKIWGNDDYGANRGGHFIASSGTDAISNDGQGDIVDFTQAQESK